MIDLIYALEHLCYYFSMTPQEFWNSTFREINIFTQANLCNLMDNFKREIRLQEAVTNKMIQADAMSNKYPKVESLFKTFKNLFPKQKEYDTIEDIKRKMKALM